MNNIEKLILWALALIVVIGGSWFLYDQLSAKAVAQSSAEESADTNGEDKVEAPDFTVYDKDGNEVSLSDFEGKPILLNFWASWCDPCKNEMPDLETAYGEYKDQVIFLAVNLTDGSYETVDSASSYVENKNYTFPVYYDTKSSAAEAYGVTSIPSNVFIDSDGYVYAGYRGALSLKNFRSHLDAIVASSPSAASGPVYANSSLCSPCAAPRGTRF